MINQLEKLLFNHNWGNSSFNIKQFNNPSLISAGIEDQGSWKVHISFDENLSKLDNILSECDKKFNQNYFLDKNNLDNLLYFIVGHEIGHWKYCPAHIDDREEILSGVAEGLEESGFTKEKIEQHSHRLYNYFADIIDNTMNMYRDDNKEKYCDGFLAFYANQGLINEYSDDFAIFVDINAKLGINKQDTKNFASHFCKNYSQLEEISQKVIEILIEDKIIASKVVSQEINLDEKVLANAYLKRNWHDKAKEFAKIFSEYIINQDENQNQMPNQGNQQQNEENDQQNENQSQGNQQQNEENDQQNQAQGTPQKGNTNEKELREMVRRSIEKGHSISYANDIIAMDELYKMRAEQIVIKMEQNAGESLKLPIGYLSKQTIDDTVNFNKIDFQDIELELDKDGEFDLVFFEQNVPFFAENKGYEPGGSIPDILFVVDRSGSMTGDYDPKEGTGNYDMLLRSIYSSLRKLEENDQIQYMKFATILFDDIPNYFTGWHNYYNIDKTKEALLDPENEKYNLGRSGYGTALDKTTIQEANDQNDKKFWAIIISDGEIENLEDACEGISNLAEQGNYINYIRIDDGYRSQKSEKFENHIKSVGGSVSTVKDPDDLPQLVLEQTKHMYGR